MPAATLALSRSMRIPLSNRQDTNESTRIPDEWGPSSVPPTTQSNIPWDDQVVPALRKKLEAQSQDLSKRISRIEDSDHGWAPRSRESYDRRDPRPHAHDTLDRRLSREVVHHHHRESSIDQFHNRFASVRAPSRQQAGEAVSSSFPINPSESNNGGGYEGRGSVLRNDATARAREKARQIAARQKAANQQNQVSADSAMVSSTDTQVYGSRQELESSSIDAIPEESKAAGSSASSFERKRLRTQSTPMRPSLDVIDPAYSVASSRRAQNQSIQDVQRSKASTSNVTGHQRSNSLSRRKAAAAASMDPKLMEEFGPLGATPSPTAKLLRAHQDFEGTWSPSSASPSMRQRNLQPDAFRSLSRPDQARFRESSAPPAFGQADSTVSEFGASPGSKSVNSWEDEVIPTVARKLQQEQFLKAGREGRLSRYEGLIDTWDKNGLPLSRSDVMAMQRANKLREEQQAQLQVPGEDEAEAESEERTLTPGPVAALHKKGSDLSPVDAEFGGRSRSRASSRRSQRSAQQRQEKQQGQQQQEPQELQEQQQQQQLERIPMQTFDHQPASTALQQSATIPRPEMEPVPVSAVPATATAGGAGYDNARARQHSEDKVDKGGCCCIVM